MTAHDCPCLGKPPLERCRNCRMFSAKNEGSDHSPWCEECQQDAPLPGQMRFGDDLEAEVIDDRGDWTRIGRLL